MQLFVLAITTGIGVAAGILGAETELVHGSTRSLERAVR